MLIMLYSYTMLHTRIQLTFVCQLFYIGVGRKAAQIYLADPVWLQQPPRRSFVSGWCRSVVQKMQSSRVQSTSETKNSIFRLVFGGIFRLGIWWYLPMCPQNWNGQTVGILGTGMESQWSHSVHSLRISKAPNAVNVSTLLAVRTFHLRNGSVHLWTWLDPGGIGLRSSQQQHVHGTRLSLTFHW